MNQDTVTATLIWLLLSVAFVAIGPFFVRYRLPQSAVVIALGMLMGPLWLDWIVFGEAERLITEIAVIFILFAAGYEIRWSQFITTLKPALVVGITGIITSACLGYLAGFAINGRIDEALYVGAALAATSIGISVALLSREGLLHTPVGQILLAAAVVDDILALYLLSSIHVGLSAGNGYEEVLISLVSGFLALLGIVLSLRLIHALVVRSHLHEFELLRRCVLIILAGVTAWATHRAGLSAAVGGFVAGAVLASTRRGSAEQDTVFFDGIAASIAPLFFMAVGMQITELEITDAQLLWLVFLVLTAALVGKLFVPWLISSQLSVGERWLLGATLLPRGEVGLIVASIGLKQGHLSHHGMVTLVTMTMITSLLAGLLVPVLAKRIRHDH